MTFFLHASVDWNGMRCGGGGGGKTTPRAFVIISARRRAMTRDAGPLPGRISAFTTGLQSCRTRDSQGGLKEVYHTSLDLILSFEHHAEVRCLFVLHSVSDSSSIWGPNVVTPGLGGGIETGRCPIQETRLHETRKDERENARAKTDSAREGNTGDKRARRRRTKKNNWKHTS